MKELLKEKGNEDMEEMAHAVVEAARASIAVGGNSINDYEDTILPKLKHDVEKVTKRRVRAYAKHEEEKWWSFWNEAARHKSAYEIRMGVKEEVKK